ncbi:hypothetical protein BDV93DRAFT_520725, partial [Ceratobasidium sp. AG-I]
MIESPVDNSRSTTISVSFSNAHEAMVLSEDEMSPSIDAKQSGTAASFEEKSPRSDAASLSDDTDPSASSDHDDDDDSDDEDDGFEPDHSGPTAEDEAKTRGRITHNVDQILLPIPGPPGTPPPPQAPNM